MLNPREEIKRVFGIVLIAVLIAIFCAAIPGSYVASQETTTITVTRVERVTSSSGDGKISSKYLIFTDGEVFENTDSLFFGKFNSSDLYGQLKSDKQYRIEVVGWRIPFLSMYRNILKADPLTQPVQTPLATGRDTQ